MRKDRLTLIRDLQLLKANNTFIMSENVARKNITPQRVFSITNDDGRFGKGLEDLLGGTSSLGLRDYIDVELKSCKTNSNSGITILSFDPKKNPPQGEFENSSVYDKMGYSVFVELRAETIVLNGKNLIDCKIYDIVSLDLYNDSIVKLLKQDWYKLVNGQNGKYLYLNDTSGKQERKQYRFKKSILRNIRGANNMNMNPIFSKVV